MRGKFEISTSKLKELSSAQMIRRLEERSKKIAGKAVLYKPLDYEAVSADCKKTV